MIFDATPFAPTDSIYGGGIAYSDIVKATPFFVRVAHGSLKPEEIGVTLSDNFMLVPEQSTDAIVVHHPQAKYYAVRGAGS